MGRGELFGALTCILIAIFGACVKWLGEIAKKPQRLITLIVEVASAALSGLLIFLVTDYFQLDLRLAHIICGIIGHQGAIGVGYLIRYITERILQFKNE